MKKLFTLICALMCVCMSWAQDPFSADITKCLCLTANTAGSTVELKKSGSPTASPTIYYKVNDGNWIPVDFSTETTTSIIALTNAGDKVWFCNSAKTGLSNSMSAYYYFSMTGSIAASGNIMSLVDNTCNSLEIPCNFCFCRLFGGTGFSGFEQSVLTSAPQLPATVLTPNCYYQLFRGCQGLIDAPELPATTLYNNCYYQMFRNCSNLHYIKVNFTASWDTSSNGPTYGWATSVSSTGIFICPEALDQTNRGLNSIPSGWEINKHDVSVSAVGYATVCLPFDAKITSDNATAYYVAVNDKEEIETTAASVIPAGTGVLVKTADGGAATVTFSYSTDTPDDVNGNLMIGSTIGGEKFTGDGTYYILSTGANGVGFYWDVTTKDEGASALCAQYKAVLCVPASSAPSFFSLDEAAAINTISSTTRNAAAFNLQGQAVGKDYKGIVIVNGKKLLVK